MARWNPRWYLLLFALLIVWVGGFPAARAQTSLQTAPDVDWTKPAKLALHNTGPATGPENDYAYDCTPLTFRMIDDLRKTMHEGCFVTMAFGLVEPAQSLIIFNGTDEAELIKFNGQPAPLGAVPFSAAMAVFGGFAGSGAYMRLHTYFPNALEQDHDLYQRFKAITKLPDYTISDASGQPLAINNSAMGYSARGQWLVAESPNKALVRINMATQAVLPFDTSFAVAGRPYATHLASMTISEDGRYAAVASNELNSFVVYDLASCRLVSSDDSLKPQNCASHDYWPYIREQVTGSLRSISKLRFVGDGLISFNAANDSGRESYLLSPNGPITSLIPYLGLGDSFSSGQGAFNYLTGTDTAVNHCHLSARSYPILLNQDVFGSSGHSVACSGATTHDIAARSPEYTGQTTDQRSVASRQADGSSDTILHDYTPGYLPQEDFVISYRPGVITVGVGGNDIGFNTMLLNCASPLLSLRPLVINDNDCYASYEDRLEVEQTIDRAYDKWLGLFHQLRTSSPLSRVYAIGYPQIISTAGDCGLNVHLTLKDIAFARDVTVYLNSVIRQAAAASGVSYVDVSDALAGRQLCGSSQPAVNGITAGHDVYGVLAQESFHPNADGQQLIEQAILKATHNFSGANPSATMDQAPPQTDNEDVLLQVPKTGRPVTRISPDDSIAPTTTSRQGNVKITVNGARHGLVANNRYSITIGGVAAGAINTDSSGNVITTIITPVTTPEGYQPVRISGSDQQGNPVAVTTTTYVDASADDYDGDGIKNGTDSCPRIVNTGVDADYDGTDDACDDSIQLAVTISPNDSHPTNTGIDTSTVTTPQPGGPMTVTANPQPTDSDLVDTAPAQSADTSQAYELHPGPTLLDMPPAASMKVGSLALIPLGGQIQLAAATQKGITIVGHSSRLNTVGTVLRPKQRGLQGKTYSGLPLFPWYLWLAASLCILLIRKIYRYYR